MEKALNVLKDLCLVINFNSYWTPRVEDAIAELEEAMKPKTCEGCKQSWEPNNQTFHKYFCEYLKIPIHGDFYCNRYEPKDK